MDDQGLGNVAADLCNGFRDLSQVSKVYWLTIGTK